MHHEAGREAPAPALHDARALSENPPVRHMVEPAGGAMNRLRCFVALSAICGCAQPQTTSPRIASTWRFDPPRGWIPSKASVPFGMAPLPGVREWRSWKLVQTISLQILPAGRPRRLRAILDPYFTTYSKISLCHRLPALFGKARPPFGWIISDEVAMEQRGSIAIASYYYPRFAEPDAAAETSLRSLCPIHQT
jgi:hypothetical protein